MDCLLSFVLFALYEEECGLRCRLKRSRRAGQDGRKQARSSMISIGNLSFATMQLSRFLTDRWVACAFSRSYLASTGRCLKCAGFA